MKLEEKLKILDARISKLKKARKRVVKHADRLLYEIIKCEAYRDNIALRLHNYEETANDNNSISN